MGAAGSKTTRRPGYFEKYLKRNANSLDLRVSFLLEGYSISKKTIKIQEKIMFTKIVLGLLMTACFAFVGCGLNKDAEVNAFMTDFESMTKELAAKVDANPTAAGVDEAQKILDSKKDALKKTFNDLKGSSGYISKDAEKKLTEGMTRTAQAFSEIATKHTSEIAEDPAMATKIQKLATDWQQIIQ